MAYVEWSLKGPEIASCNCNWGCPCQFNAPPTKGHCRGTIAIQIDAGRFGDVILDGLRFVGLAAWPGAIHEGRGELQWVIDQRADERQRAALLSILSGEEAEPGTFFQILISTMEKTHPPMFEAIEFEFDQEARTGRFAVPGVIETDGEPIRNPVTGEPHRARLHLPHGFEYTEAEFASGRTKAAAPIALDWTNGHAHFAMLHLTSRSIGGWGMERQTPV